LVAFLIFLKTCVVNDRYEEEDKKVQTEQKMDANNTLLKSSDIYLIGEWALHYKDITHYEYDDIGMPNFDMYKQPSSYIIGMKNKGLIVNEIYPITESQHQDNSFELKVDLKIVQLNVSGKIEDKNNWSGTLEYVGDGEQLISKCTVRATRE